MLVFNRELQALVLAGKQVGFTFFSALVEHKHTLYI